jgi:TatD DNase family protein
MLFDAHNHLQDAWLAPHQARIVADLRHANVGRVVVNGTCQTDWADVTGLARAHPVVGPSLGLHPWDAGNATPTWRDDLCRALDATPGAAIGEIGIDRWILDRARPDDPRLAGLRRASLAEQIEIFVWQLELAAERNLPASIHCLDAWGELLRALRHARRPARGFLLHAYGGSAELARDFAALGAYFSFNTAFIESRHAATGRSSSVSTSWTRRRHRAQSPRQRRRRLRRASRCPRADGRNTRCTSGGEFFPPFRRSPASLRGSRMKSAA